MEWFLASVLVVMIAAIVAVELSCGRLRVVTNKGVDQAADKTPALIDRAERSLMILTDLEPKFHEDRRVVEVLERAVDRGVEVRVLCGPQPPA